jgi:hypothetical protein
MIRTIFLVVSVLILLPVFFTWFKRSRGLKGKKEKGERVEKFMEKFATENAGSWYLQQARRIDGDEKILEIILKENTQKKSKK